MNNNAIDLVRGDLQRHKATVKLPGKEAEEMLYLVLISAKTSTLKDFMATYGKQVTETHRKIAAKIFGENETENTYGVFVDETLRMVFAFNRAFADYDAKTKAVVFKSPDDILIEKIEVKKDGTPRTPIRERSSWGVPTMLVKYSLAE